MGSLDASMSCNLTSLTGIENVSVTFSGSLFNMEPFSGTEFISPE
jgi:hypothetical protein